MKAFKLLFLIILFLTFKISLSQNLTSPPPVPSQHPRIFITPDDISLLKEKINLPEFYSFKKGVYESSKPIFKAFRYLIDGDKSVGRSAVTGAISKLKNFNLSRGRRQLNDVVLGALVYDWCYPLLTSDEKKKFISEFERIHDTHSPYWPVQYGFEVINGHNAEGWFFNQLIASVAIYDEAPSVYQNNAGKFFEKYIAPRNFFFPSHMHHQGEYIGVRYSHSLFAAWMFRKMSGGKHIFNEHAQYVMYQQLYGMRPDRKQMRRGDVTSESGRYGEVAISLGLAADYFDDPYLYDLEDLGHFKNYSFKEDFFCKFLFRAPNPSKKPVSELPLTYYHEEPVGGEMIARTGWDRSNINANDAIAQMRIGNYYFGNHQHKDFGTFQIYYKGILAQKSGVFARAFTDHDISYTQQSISANSIIIYNPNEQAPKVFDKGESIVDGGIRWPYHVDDGEKNAKDLNQLLDPKHGYEIGKTTAYEFGPDKIIPEYSYISGDITNGYRGKAGTVFTDRAELVTRSMVAFNTKDEKYPMFFVVFDRVISTDPSFKKTWLLHSEVEPNLNGTAWNTTRGDGYNGKLEGYTLLPMNPKIRKIGGTGQEYTIHGVNIDPIPLTGSLDKDGEYGKWRIELSPSQANKEDLFLNVMAVMNDGVAGPGAERIINDDYVGAKIKDIIVTFSKSGELLSHLNLPVEGADLLKVLLCDIKPGHYDIYNNGKLIETLSAGEQGKTLYFNTAPGNIEIIEVSTPYIVSEK